MEYVGRAVKRDFKGIGISDGVVESYDESSGTFRIVYGGSDSEELELTEVESCVVVGPELKSAGGYGRDHNHTVRKKRGRKPKRPHWRTVKSTRSEEASSCKGSIDLDGKFESENEGLRAVANVGNNSSCDGPLKVELVRKDVPVLNVGCDGGVDVNFSNLLDLNQSFVLNDGVSSNVDETSMGNQVIDLNLDLNVRNEERNTACNEERPFDLNMDLDDEINGQIGDFGEQLKKNAGSQMSEMESSCLNESLEGHQFAFCRNDSTPNGTLKREPSIGVLEDYSLTRRLEGMQMNDISNADSTPVRDYFATKTSTPKQKSDRKRRKLSDAANSTVESSLRRSTRRTRSAVSAQDHIPPIVNALQAVNSLASPAVSAVSEDQHTISGCEDSEEPSILPPKLLLPASSKSLNLDGVPVLELFSVYSFLRSFSTLLFLSPFKLTDFVTSLRNKGADLLIDSIHVSLLQTLRKHLESLPDEISPSASNCLRSLNWNLLDLTTWPIFIFEYLLMHSSGIKPGSGLFQLKLFETDYYKLPEPTKIEILQCLCDDVIEVEAARAEINRRTSVDPNNIVDSDRNTRYETAKNQGMMDSVGTAEELADDATDWNSDECCLCKMDGILICCDGCPAAFHSKCVGVASSLLPEGDWFCPECVLDRDSPWMKVGKSVRGAELLGTDPHGRHYYSSCGYLVVLDQCGAESSFHYYENHDLNPVIEALKSSGSHYCIIASAIEKHLNVSTSPKSDMDSDNPGLCSESVGEKATTLFPTAPLTSTETCSKEEIINEGCELVSTGSLDVDQIKAEKPLASSEGSVENSQVTRVRPKRSSGQRLEQEKNVQSTGIGNHLPTISTGPDICATSYVNFYSFARIAFSVSCELARNSSDKVCQESSRSLEELVSAQMKVISNLADKFCWLTNLNTDVRKEKCGWCLSCKVPDFEGDCLFIVNDTAPVLESLTGDLADLRSRRNMEGRTVDVIGSILCIEHRLRGLLLGPWLNPHFTHLWRESVLQATDVATVKNLLLLLESNISPLAISVDWLKHVDSMPRMGSASHVIISSPRFPPKHVNGRGKSSKNSYVKPKALTNAASGLGLLWWRGGKLSRQLFSWKILPRSLASKAARQAGCKKIHGLLYQENSDIVKRSRCFVWRASVETSVGAEQLAFQVRELDQNIRWDDIENNTSKMDKEASKTNRFFKKVSIRRKCSEGEVVKYLLDFGKRRFIPNIVTEHGCKLKESSSERKKYWLEESYVPLHLLKAFEERKAALKSNKVNSGKLPERKILNKLATRKGFSYLFSKAERDEHYQCGHCEKTVTTREAVSCRYCEGFFHKKHAVKSKESSTGKSPYACHKCQNEKCVKIGTKKEKSKLMKKASVHVKPGQKKRGRPPGKKLPTQSKTKKDIAVVVPLRRSARQVKIVSLQSTKTRVKKGKKGKTGKKAKSRNWTKNKLINISWFKRGRTQFHSAYWINGLRITRKSNDERVIRFRSKIHTSSCEQSVPLINQPKCSVCVEPESTSALTYISCEICGDWFHGDAFGLKAENIGDLVGFRCHKCRNRSPPVCPHQQATRDDFQIMDGMNNDVGTECAGVSSDVALPKEV